MWESKSTTMKDCYQTKEAAMKKDESVEMVHVPEQTGVDHGYY